MFNDMGILFEIIGFLMLLLTANRNPKSGQVLMNTHEEHPFNIFREKIVPDRFVYHVFVAGIALVLSGLIFQFTYFNSNT